MAGMPDVDNQSDWCWHLRICFYRRSNGSRD